MDLSKKKTAVFLGVLLLATACGITKKYELPSGLQTQGLFRDGSQQDSATIADIPWRQLFTDSILQELIEKGISNNYDLKTAVSNMQIAANNLSQSRSAFLPDLSVSPQMTYGKAEAALNVASVYALQGSASWEIDLWGKLRSNKRAYLAAFQQTEAYRRAIQTQLVADIATAYYQLLAYDEQIKIVKKTIENRKADVETTRALKENAVVTGADVVNSEAALHSAEIQLPDLNQSQRELENSISLLLGMPPGAIARSSFSSQQIDSSLKTGVSSQLLANRPDVQQAEATFRNAFELTNVARTYFYPALAISASGGWATTNSLENFFKSTFYGTVLGGITQPVLNQGVNRQRLRNALSTQQEAYYSFQKTLLTAGQEVSNALYAHQIAQQKETIRKEQIRQLEKVVDYTKELLKYRSTTNYTDVLTAEENLLAAQLSGISDRLSELTSVVTLYRALGGGWEKPQPPDTE